MTCLRWEATFKGLKNYFTDALLYQETGETSKESLSDDDDSGNEADSESEEDMVAILIGELIVTCLNNPQCNTPSEDEGESVINDNISFDYPVSAELFESIMDSSRTCLYISQVHQVHLWNS